MLPRVFLFAQLGVLLRLFEAVAFDTLLIVVRLERHVGRVLRNWDWCHAAFIA